MKAAMNKYHFMIKKKNDWYINTYYYHYDCCQNLLKWLPSMDGFWHKLFVIFRWCAPVKPSDNEHLKKMRITCFIVQWNDCNEQFHSSMESKNVANGWTRWSSPNVLNVEISNWTNPSALRSIAAFLLRFGSSIRPQLRVWFTNP